MLPPSPCVIAWRTTNQAELLWGGYLDRVDDEFGEEEDLVDGQTDEYKRDRHGWQFQSSEVRRKARAEKLLQPMDVSS
jgi:hypothetical protein